MRPGSRSMRDLATGIIAIEDGKGDKDREAFVQAIAAGYVKAYLDLWSIGASRTEAEASRPGASDPLLAVLEKGLVEARRGIARVPLARERHADGGSRGGPICTWRIGFGAR